MFCDEHCEVKLESLPLFRKMIILVFNYAVTEKRVFIVSQTLAFASFKTSFVVIEMVLRDELVV